MCNASVTTRRTCYGSCVSGVAAELRLKFCVSCGWLGSESDSAQPSYQQRTSLAAAVPPTHRIARRASNVPARCVTRTFAAEQVCGGWVLCVTRIRRWHRARTLEARLSRSRLVLNLHLPAVWGAQTVPATHVGGAPPCAARTSLLRSRRRRSARSSYCTLFNNRCVLFACPCVSQNMHRRRAAERCTAGCDRGFKTRPLLS